MNKSLCSDRFYDIPKFPKYGISKGGLVINRESGLLLQGSTNRSISD
jgi:hypothetical protein